MNIWENVSNYSYTHAGGLETALEGIEIMIRFAMGNQEKAAPYLERYESLIRQHGACTPQSIAVLKTIASEENRAIIEEGNLLHLGNCIQEEHVKQSSPYPSLMLTVEEMAKQLRIGRAKAYELARTPGFPAIKVGKRTLVNRDELTKWLAENAGKRTEEMYNG